MTRMLIRPGRADDALCLGVLATQVFLCTYARNGITKAIATEVRSAFSTEAFAALLSAPDTQLQVAEIGGHSVGFVQTSKINLTNQPSSYVHLKLKLCNAQNLQIT